MGLRPSQKRVTGDTLVRSGQPSEPGGIESKDEWIGEQVDGPRRRDLTVGRWLGCAALGGQLIALLVLSTHLYHAFNLGWDFSIFHQAWYQIAHGTLDPKTGPLPHPHAFWRDEFGLILWPLAPLYYVYPHAITLLFVQDVATVGAEVVAFLWLIEALGRRPTDTRFETAFVVAVCLVLMVANPWMYLANIQDFHLEALATLFLVLAAREAWRGGGFMTWIWVGATLLVGTVGAVSVVGLGISVLVASRSTRRLGGAMIAVGAAWTAFIIALPANLGAGTEAYRYLADRQSGGGFLAVIKGVLSHPSRATNVISERASRLYDNFASFGYIGILWPWFLGLGLLTTILYILNSNDGFIQPGFQNLTLYVFGALGTAWVLKWLLRWPKARYATLVLGVLLIANAVAFSVKQMPGIFMYRVEPAAAAELGKVLTATPSDAEVVASYGIAGRFSGRQSLQIVTPYPDGRVVRIEARTVVFVFAPQQGNQPLPADEVMAEVGFVRDGLHAQVLDERSGVYAFRWEAPPTVRSLTLP